MCCVLCCVVFVCWGKGNGWSRCIFDGSVVHVLNEFTGHMAQIGVERDALLLTLEQTIAELKDSLTFNTIGQKVTTHFQNQRVLANARKQVAEQVQRRQQLEAMMNAMQVPLLPLCTEYVLHTLTPLRFRVSVPCSGCVSCECCHHTTSMLLPNFFVIHSSYFFPPACDLSDRPLLIHPTDSTRRGHGRAVCANQAFV